MTSTADRAELWRRHDQGLPFEPLLTGPDTVVALRRDFAHQGFAVFGPEAIDPDLHERLVIESKLQRGVSAWDLVGDGSAGSMSQDNTRAQLGPLARFLIASSAMRGFLWAVTGHPVIPGWSATCLTFYDQVGQYLGHHRDKVDACHVAVLFYLEAVWPGQHAGPGMQLHIERFDEDPTPYRITARPNRIVVLHGSRLTHYRPPLASGEAVTLIAGCYALADVM